MSLRIFTHENVTYKLKPFSNQTKIESKFVIINYYDSFFLIDDTNHKFNDDKTKISFKHEDKNIIELTTKICYEIIEIIQN